jgi:hypothetical protein
MNLPMYPHVNRRKVISSICCDHLSAYFKVLTTIQVSLLRIGKDKYLHTTDFRVIASVVNFVRSAPKMPRACPEPKKATEEGATASLRGKQGPRSRNEIIVEVKVIRSWRCLTWGETRLIIYACRLGSIQRSRFGLCIMWALQVGTVFYVLLFVFCFVCTRFEKLAIKSRVTYKLDSKIVFYVHRT